MVDDDRLKWVQRNRTRRNSVQQAGTLLARLAERVAVDGVSSEIAAALASVVDEEFRRHCRIGGVRSGTLMVSVDEASLAYAMRMQWLAPLSKALSASAGIGPIDRIAFEFGHAGVRVPAREDQPVRD